MKSGDKTVDIRVSTLSTDFGEKVVLRILDRSSLKLSLDVLGFEKKVLADFKKVLKMPYGMVLATGPTGSGKTTTLYAALNFLNKADVNIITIEDPIEYNLPGINQTMVKPEIGLTFAGILRTVLRQDPNIIMVGEIRDSETAEIAVRSALTGHLVLSTLHTNDAISTIVRLIDMGVEPFLVANSLKMVIAQRLIRKICPKCRTEDKEALTQFQHYNLPAELKEITHYKGARCQYCNQTGFSGREAIIEHLIIDDEFARLILNNADISQLRAFAKSKNLMTLKEAGFQKIVEGKTTLSETISETFVF
jgi:type IV pilus assembly protein PilB